MSTVGMNPLMKGRATIALVSDLNHVQPSYIAMSEAKVSYAQYSHSRPKTTKN